MLEKVQRDPIMNNCALNTPQSQRRQRFHIGLNNTSLLSCIHWCLAYKDACRAHGAAADNVYLLVCSHRKGTNTRFSRALVLFIMLGYDFVAARRAKKPLYVMPDLDLRPRWKRSVPTVQHEHDSDDQDSDTDEFSQNDTDSDNTSSEPESQEAFYFPGFGDVPELIRPAVDVFDETSSQQQCSLPLESPSDLREGHIRLLRIASSGSFDAGIRCTTRIFPLHRMPKYVAISYTWGSPIACDSRYNITLDGRKHLLPKNLWRFLQQASETESIWLWIDALSIDQRRPEERSHQVGIMSDIFSNAVRVVVWLGPAYERSNEAMEALLKPYELHLPATLGDPRTKKAVEALFVRPYWSRVWVYQELKSAKRLSVMCGNALLDWAALEIYVHDLYMDHDVQDLFDTPAVRMILLRTRSMGTSLWHLLEATKHLRCSDQRDRVYALLSVATTGHEGIHADYTIRVADLVYDVLDNMCKINPPTKREEAVDRCLDLAEIFQADLKSLSRLEGLLKGYMMMPDFVALTDRMFTEALEIAHKRRREKGAALSI
jgi:hypothetical protein